MGVKEEQLLEWIEKGWRCLNCGEHVPDSCDVVQGKFVCSGKCTSDTCRKLPLGGNPFYVVIE